MESKGHVVDAALEPAVKEALVDELYARSRSSFVGLALVLIALRALLDPVFAISGAMHAIFIGMIAVLAGRVALVLIARKKQGFFASVERRHLVFGIGSTTISLLFCAMNVVAFPHLDAAQLATLVMCHTGINAIALVNMGSSPTLYHLYMVPNVAPMVLITAIGPHGSGLRLLPVMIVLFMTVLSVMALHEYRSRRDNIVLRLQVAEMALVDALTKLRNRRYLQEFMTGEVEQVQRQWSNSSGSPTTARKRLVLMMVDLDHFKEVNDKHGHDAGDQVLRQLADVLRDTVRKQDVVARWGGEEFVVVARMEGAEDGAALAERIRKAVEARAFKLPDGVSTVVRTCSIGYASYPFWPSQPGVLGWDDVLAVADGALYRAKQTGRNRVIGIAGGEPGDRELLRKDFDRASERGLLRVVS
ncbi:MAG: diguanylate cyclase [Polyangiales bacterium]